MHKGGLTLFIIIGDVCLSMIEIIGGKVWIPLVGNNKPRVDEIPQSILAYELSSMSPFHLNRVAWGNCGHPYQLLKTVF